MREKTVLCRIAILFGLAALISGCTFELVDPPPPTEIALRSIHDRYVTALGEEEGWALGQETELGDCGWFTLRHLANGKIALKTCHDRYVTAPASGTETADWVIVQEPSLGPCGQFDSYELGSDRVALRTCANRFLTPGDGTWPEELAWSVVGETENLMDWEIMTMLER
jgi:hypothetical protein